MKWRQQQAGMVPVGNPGMARQLSLRLIRSVPLLLICVMLTVCIASATIPYEPHLRSEVFRDGWAPQGLLTWPPNDGFAGTPAMVVLQPGTLIDQFSDPVGNFFYAAGTPYSKRALPYVCNELFYRMYRVLVPVPALAGRVAPWFEEPGGGEQFKTNASAKSLMQDSKLSLVAEIWPDSKSAMRPCD